MSKTVHMLKLSVGTESVEGLAQWQDAEERLAALSATASPSP